MARFRGTVQGGRSEASRLGHASSGLHVTCNGWAIGLTAYLTAYIDADSKDRDRLTIYVTGGSNDRRKETLVGTYYADTLNHNRTEPQE